MITNLPQKSSTVLAVVISAIGVIVTVIVIALMVIIARRRHRQKDNHGSNTRKQRNKKKKKQQRKKVAQEMSSTLHGCENTGQTNEYEVYEVYEETANVASSSATADKKVGLELWMIPWSSLVFKKVLGNGYFGKVHEGEVKLQHKVTKLAVIAQLEENASVFDTERFMEELETMSTIGQHANVVSILGACQRNAVRYVAWEYLPKGNIRSFLRENRDNDMTTVSPANLIRFVLDVAKGMQHIAASGVVHCELSSSNIVLSNDMVAMVSGIGLSKSADICVKPSEAWNPCRCLALESLTNNIFTTMSDVWSFGVVVWEITTLGRIPYANIETLELASKLTGGYRMAKPRKCSDEIYNLMLQCWQKDPNKRPKFQQILEDLTAITLMYE